MALAAPEGAIESGFSTDALTVQADAPIELEFDNEDPGVGHNVQIFDGADDSAPSLFDGAAITGTRHDRHTGSPRSPRATTSSTVGCTRAPRCRGRSPCRKGRAASRSSRRTPRSTPTEIDLPADTPSTLTLDNQDPFDHNLSIYEDDTASGEPLFTFDAFAGPDVRDLPRGSDPGGQVLLPVRHPPEHGGNRRGRAAAARRGRKCAARRRGSGRESERLARRGRLRPAGSVARVLRRVALPLLFVLLAALTACTGDDSVFGCGGAGSAVAPAPRRDPRRRRARCRRLRGRERARDQRVGRLVRRHVAWNSRCSSSSRIATRTTAFGSSASTTKTIATPPELGFGEYDVPYPSLFDPSGRAAADLGLSRPARHLRGGSRRARSAGSSSARPMGRSSRG